MQTSWIGTGYFIGSAAFQPLFASLSHIFGRKLLTVGALFIFLVGTILCSVARDIDLLLAGRVIQGIGSGGCIAMSDVLITDIIPLRQRADYFGLVSLAWAVGTIVGPVAGAALGQTVTWRWLFWILIPFNVIAIAVIMLFLRLRRVERNMAEKLKEVDYVGSILFCASSTSFLLGISFGGTEHPWASYQTLLPLILGILGLALFVLWELRVTNPVVPMRIFSTWTAAQGYLGVTTTGMTIWAVVYYLPLYYEGVLGYSFIFGGVAILPMTLSTAPGAAVTGALITKFGRFRPFLWVGWGLTVLGSGLLLDLKEDTSVPQWIFLSIWAGLGIGMLLSSMQIAVQAAAEDRDSAVAAAMVVELRTIGQALGLAIFSAAFANVTKHALHTSPDITEGQAIVMSSNVYTLVQVIRNSPDGHQKDALKHALWLGCRAVWITNLPFVVVSAVASIWTKGLSLDRILMTEHIVVGTTNNREKEVS